MRWYLKEGDMAPTDRDAVNVMYQGAVGDGRTDDTEAFERSMRLAYVIGAVVIVPPGAYEVSPRTVVALSCYRPLNAEALGAY